MQSLVILGRQPALGLAELESLYGAGDVVPIGQQAAIINVDPCLLAFDRLGGSLKFCKLLTKLDTVDWRQIEKFLIDVSPNHSQMMPEGKMQLGLSVVGFEIGLKDLHATGLKLKKAIRQTGRPVRLIPNKAHQLNSAQVIHNKLTGEHGWELVLIREGRRTWLAQTVKVQDIEAYAARDQSRPMRDAKVGMLPPKLAQIIVNLAAGQLPTDKLESICEIPAGQVIPRPLLDKTVLDPFCGSGVILQEAALMGYRIAGSDNDKRMADYTRQNLEWLSKLYGEEFQPEGLEVADATSHRWDLPFDFVASETYLGRPFTLRPSEEVLAQTMADCNLIIKKFLQNIAVQLGAGTRLCLAVPAWQTRPGSFRFLPLIDSLGDFGYNRVSLEHVGSEDLIYHRPGQIVARQLLVITKE